MPYAYRAESVLGQRARLGMGRGCPGAGAGGGIGSGAGGIGPGPGGTGRSGPGGGGTPRLGSGGMVVRGLAESLHPAAAGCSNVAGVFVLGALVAWWLSDRR
jgi:hypothetical protein